MPISAKESLSKLNKEITSCKKCVDLVEIERHPNPGSGASKANIIIVSSYPPSDEREGKNNLSSIVDQDKFIRKILNKTGLSLTKDIYMTYLVKCSPAESIESSRSSVSKPAKPLKKHINNCISFLTREISIITPHIIVSLGVDVSNIILRKFFSVEKKYRNIEKIHMRIFENPSFKLVPFFDPQDVLINGTVTEERYLRDFESLSKFLKIV